MLECRPQPDSYFNSHFFFLFFFFFFISNTHFTGISGFYLPFNNIDMTSRYTAVHAAFTGPGDGRPTALQIVHDEELEGKLDGKVILITGCSSGIGIETARALHATGATLYLTARNIDKIRQMAPDLAGSPRVHLLRLELGSLQAVHDFAKDFKSKTQMLNVLIANAGVMATPEGRTTDGFETQFGTNHLAHFLLFQLLKPLLLASATPTFHSRVVVLASLGHRFSTVHLDNLNLEGEYDPWVAYGQSKSALIWTANEIERRFGSKGLHGWSVHPGSIATELQRHMTEETKEAWTKNDQLTRSYKTVEQGAATTVWAAIATELEGKGGKFVEDCSIARLHEESDGDFGPGYAPHAYNPEGEAELWKESLKLVGLQDE
jgi:NAD(P)-dependent dehydrogenase (short-subunit alcohol dehydrogenase family)